MAKSDYGYPRKKIMSFNGKYELCEYYDGVIIIWEGGRKIMTIKKGGLPEGIKQLNIITKNRQPY